MKTGKKGETAIIPRPKDCQFYEGRFELLQKTPIVPAQGSASCKEAPFLSSLLEKGTGVKCLVVSASRSRRIELQIVHSLPGVEDKEESYMILVTPDMVTLQATTDRGLFYACQSLLDLVKRDGSGWIIPSCEVRDWPDFPYRGFLADPARYFFSLDRLKWDVDNLARNKYNFFHLHFSDSESFTLPTRRYPKLNVPPEGPHGVYTQSEIRELCRYAADRKIEIIPEIELPGHATYMIRQYPELKCKVAGGKVSEWAICIGAENTYEFLENLLDEIAPLFPGRFFHIGTDELEFQDFNSVFISWRECSECRSRVEKEGLKNYRELFYYFLRRMRDILAKHGKRMMMWNDNIDISKPHTVPHDILLHFWRIAAKGRGPRRGCSLKKFVEDGFEVVNSFYPETYLDVHIREERLVRWHPHKNPRVLKPHRGQIIGGECCAWSDGGIDPYIRSLPSAWALFADRVWNKAPVTDADSFASALPKHIFSPQVPDKMRNYFHVQGGIAFKGRQIYAIEPVILKPIPPKERLELCDKLLQLITAERREKRLMNFIVLKEYAEALKALRHELVAMVKMSRPRREKAATESKRP